MNRIENYDELVAERLMTETIIANQKQDIHDRLELLKEKLAPLLLILPMLSVFRKTDPRKNALLKAGTSVAIDLVGQKVLGKANWISRIFVPTLLKTISSRLIEKVYKDKKED